MKKTIATIALSVLATLAVAPGQTASAERVEWDAIAQPKWMQRECKVEDSTGCYYDARREGDKIGYSHFNKRVGHGKNALICVFYVDSKYAKKHDFCTKA